MFGSWCVGRNRSNVLGRSSGFLVRLDRMLIRALYVVREIACLFVCLQEAQARLLHHVVIHSNTLMGQRLDHGDFSSKGRIEKVSIGEAFTLNNQSHNIGIRRKI